MDTDMLETAKANGEAFTGIVRLVHAVGMHARPAVKLTKLAKRFAANVAIRVEGAADWINAKSVAKVMAMRAAHGSMMGGGYDQSAQRIEKKRYATAIVVPRFST